MSWAHIRNHYVQLISMWYDYRPVNWTAFYSSSTHFLHNINFELFMKTIKCIRSSIRCAINLYSHYLIHSLTDDWLIFPIQMSVLRCCFCCWCCSIFSYFYFFLFVHSLISFFQWIEYGRLFSHRGEKQWLRIFTKALKCLRIFANPYECLIKKKNKLE